MCGVAGVVPVEPTVGLKTISPALSYVVPNGYFEEPEVGTRTGSTDAGIRCNMRGVLGGS